MSIIFKYRFRESVNVDALCNGRLCPRRLHFGLLIIHAWTPHSKNSITADHVAYNFVRLEDLERFPENGEIRLPGKQRAIDSVLRAKGTLINDFDLIKKPRNKLL
jgi:hypothetical protein